MAITKRCTRHSNCRVCTTNYSKAKANGKRCRSMYWAMKKLAERMPGIPVPGPTVNEEGDIVPNMRLREILDNLRDQPTEDSDLKGDCCVCYETFNSTERKPVTSQCGHVVCITCMASGQLRNCPKCSTRIEKVIPLFL